VAVDEQGLSERESASETPHVDQLRARIKVEESVAGTWHTLTLSGELDLASAPAFAESVERIGMSPTEGVVLDLSAVTFLDSSGIHTVIALQQRCQKQDVALRIIPGPAQVQHIFALCGLLEHLPFIEV
jgi:anti-sigma B factor antagonist